MSRMPKTVELSARDIVDRVRAGELTRVEVVQAHLDVVASSNASVGALVAVRGEEALREADEADRTGNYRGILDGVPMSVKSEYDVAGLPTTHGNKNMVDEIARQDSPVVARLRAQGAIIIGKGNQPDFAMRWNTHSSELGWTRNPRDLNKSVGGSSGGDAAAVAAGMVAVGFGTDLAGSIRVPAAFSQIYGLRATPGRIPYASEHRDSVRSPAVEAMSSQGPLARTVDDLRVAFAATAGASARHPFSLSSQPCVEETTGPLRVARIVHQSGADVSPEMEEKVDETCRALEEVGYQIEDAEFPGVNSLPQNCGCMCCRNCAK
ncbi:amidase [Rhodoglobus vestalii]|uniref:amidase n=1 Tax=Rhodoglobus vestalii TaxID=193384 RepID=UPI00114DC85F|nr:amidase family protein [Rhodoglobus vestalii]